MTTMPRPEAPGAGGPAPQVSVGPYTLLARIGEGGMGVVHLARRPGGERVALKVLRPHIVGDDEARARLAREVGSLSRIRSRWVAEIVDADPWAPVPYVATRYVPGLSLHDHVIEEGPIQGKDLTWFATCLAEGLATVHAAGVLHRDIKPSNVLMEGRTPILIDFGLARVADDPKLTHTGWLLGTPGYLAPEILYGDDATAASDVHSWAATVAFAALGRPPFGRGPSMAIMDRVRRGEHELSGMPGHLHGLLVAALDPEPERRPALGAILDWLRPQVAPAAHAVPPAEPTRDVRSLRPQVTVPLAVASQQVADGLTDHLTLPPTRVEPVQPRPTQPAPLSMVPPLAPPAPPRGAPPLAPPPNHDGMTRLEQEWDERWAEPLAPTPGVRAPLGERLRRGLLLASGAVLTGAGLAAYPWFCAVLVFLAVLLMRSGSLAASAAGDRRRLRGRKWYDGVLFLVRTPWDLLRSTAGTILLVLWSAGLAVAAALICYAVAAGVPVTLFVAGVVLAVALWSGPGGSRVRSPLARVVEPLSRDVRAWLVALVVVVAGAGFLGFLVADSGTAWTPDDDRPLSNVDAPAGFLGR